MPLPRPLATLLACLALCLTAPAASARPDLCETAARAAAREVGVPPEVLLAIALTETGREMDGRLRPWPWAANAEGRGHWFATRAEAARFARAQMQRGEPSFDLGCFQINWRWHGHAFPGPEALLDPPVAARYAARLLARLHDELGSWERAAGAYHSRTPALADRYRARFARILGTMDAPEAETATRPPPPRDPAPARAHPLFAGQAAGPSLVPAALPRRPPLLAPRP